MPNSEQVMSWAKISRRQLDNWVDKGYLVPIRVMGRGFAGKSYDWTHQEAKVAERMGALTTAGIAPAMAAKFARRDEAALDKVLRALAGCVDELRWRHTIASEGLTEAEPCG